MQAQTYLDVRRGLEEIRSQILNVIHGSDEEKSLIATDIGALNLLDSIDEITTTIRDVIKHDNGTPVSFVHKLLHRG